VVVKVGIKKRPHLATLPKGIQRNDQNLVRYAHNWNNGIVECWNIGFLLHRHIPGTLTIIPLFQHSIIPCG
jgi:hypothetical protein